MFGEFRFPFFVREPDVWRVSVRKLKTGTHQKSGSGFRSGKSDPRPQLDKIGGRQSPSFFSKLLFSEWTPMKNSTNTFVDRFVEIFWDF